MVLLLLKCDFLIHLLGVLYMIKYNKKAIILNYRSVMTYTIKYVYT